MFLVRFVRLPEADVSVLDLKKLASLFAAQKYTDRIASAIAKCLGEMGNDWHNSSMQWDYTRE